MIQLKMIMFNWDKTFMIKNIEKYIDCYKNLSNGKKILLQLYKIYTATSI
jgi:hypothetical protein